MTMMIKKIVIVSVAMTNGYKRLPGSGVVATPKGYSGYVIG